MTAAHNIQPLLHCSHHLFVFRIHFANDEKQQPKQAPLRPDTTTHSHAKRRASPAAPCGRGHPAGSRPPTAGHHPRHRPHPRLGSTTGPAARQARPVPRRTSTPLRLGSGVEKPAAGPGRAAGRPCLGLCQLFAPPLPGHLRLPRRRGESPASPSLTGRGGGGRSAAPAWDERPRRRPARGSGPGPGGGRSHLQPRRPTTKGPAGTGKEAAAAAAAAPEGHGQEETCHACRHAASPRLCPGGAT